VPRSPLSHLVGYRVTQVGLGVATVTMPASPWLQGLDDTIMVDVLLETAMTVAAMTGAPPGASVRLLSTSTSRFRPATCESGTLIARARTLHTGRTLTFVEVVAEDSLGRQVCHATAATVVRPVVTPPAPLGDLDDEPPVDPPTYPTPDPWQRPLPPGVGIASQDLWDQHDGPAIARMYATGQLPTMPVAALLNIRVLDWDEGRVQAAMPASRWLSGEHPTVAAGVIALLAHTTLGGSTAVKLDRRRRQVGIVDDTVSFHRNVPCDGRDIVAAARIVYRLPDSVVSSAEITDAEGNLVAVGHRTSVFLDERPDRASKADRLLLTVLFTDIVNSTATAEQLGDEKWSVLLARHHEAVRRQLTIHGGREVKTTGDGFLATFDSPSRALACARAGRDAVAGLGLKLRAALHTGECEVAGGDVSGLAVHLASRLLPVAGPGDIVVSATVRDLTVGSGVQLVEAGHHQFQGLDGTWAVFKVDG
jgi:class 3 adenylate cyclase